MCIKYNTAAFILISFFIIGCVSAGEKIVINDSDADLGLMFNEAVDELRDTGGLIVISPGLYTAETELTISYFPRSLKVEAYGANIRTVGAISALRIETDPGAGRRGTKIVIEGLEVDQAGNREAIAGIHLDGAWHVTIRDCVLTGDGGNNSEWAAIRLNKGSSNNIHSLWNKIEGCRISREFGNGALPHGIRLIGRSNATIIRDNSFGSVSIGISIEATDSVLSNGVVINGNTCENGGVLAYTGAFVKITTLTPSTTIKGIEISSGRYEKLAYALEIVGDFKLLSKGIVLNSNQYDDQTKDVNNPRQLEITKIAE